MLMSIANFNIIEIFGQNSEVSKYLEVFDNENETPLNENFKKMGYESLNMLKNN